MKNLCVLLCFIFMCSCTEKLIEKPDNLISKDEITNILYDLAILNAAKSSNSSIFTDNGIEPMQFLFSKYKIDSTQFTESNRYYASFPDEYESIYKALNERLETESTELQLAKKIRDSLKGVERKAKSQKIIKKSKGEIKEVIDSLQ